MYMPHCLHHRHSAPEYKALARILLGYTSRDLSVYPTSHTKVLGNNISKEIVFGYRYTSLYIA
jgi:hypothetical protein